MLPCLDMFFAHPPSCPAFPQTGFASPSSSGPCTRPQRYYAGSDSSPARTHRQGLSASFVLPSEHPAPNHVVGPDITLSSTSVCRPGVTTQASSWDRGLAAPQRRNGFVILRAARSSPAALHPASRFRSWSTQLPSTTCGVTSHGVDFHLPDRTTLQTHGPRLRGDDSDWARAKDT
jgi:hypothetical protein